MLIISENSYFKVMSNEYKKEKIIVPYINNINQSNDSNVT